MADDPLDADRRSADDIGVDPLARYPDLYAWVTQWLLPVYRRSVSRDDVTWCAQWWQHHEAVVRLSALWRAWLAAHSDDGAAMSAWWAYHADHHLPIILSAQGPLKGCTPERHSDRPTEQLPSTPPEQPVFAELERLAPAPVPAARLDPWDTTGDPST